MKTRFSHSMKIRFPRFCAAGWRSSHGGCGSKLKRLACGAIVAMAMALVSGTSAASDLTLTWDPNTEPELAGYTLHYGRTSGVYRGRFDVGLRNTVEMSLSAGSTFYFVVTAYNIAGDESLPSNEVEFTAPTDVSPLTLPPSSVVSSPTLMAPDTLLFESLEPGSGEGDLPGDGPDVALSAVTRLGDGSCQFRVRARSGGRVTISVSTDLESWRVLGEVANPSGVLLLRDLEAIGLPQRYYRVE